MRGSLEGTPIRARAFALVVAAALLGPAAAGARDSNEPVRSPRGVEAESASASGAAPPARAHHRLTSLPGGGIVLVGGSTRTDSGYVWFDDVWTRRSGVWQRDKALPFGRSSHALAYDGARGALILVGGIEGGPAPGTNRSARTCRRLSWHFIRYQIRAGSNRRVVMIEGANAP